VPVPVPDLYRLALARKVESTTTAWIKIGSRNNKFN